MKKQFRLAVLVGLLISVTWATAQQRPRRFQLKADLPKFWELVPKDAKLELVSGGMGFTEGPVWDPSGFVYVSDEVLNKIFRIYPDGHREELVYYGHNVAVQAQDECSWVCAVPDEIKNQVRGVKMASLRKNTRSPQSQSEFPGPQAFAYRHNIARM